MHAHASLCEWYFCKMKEKKPTEKYIYSPLQSGQCFLNIMI